MERKDGGQPNLNFQARELAGWATPSAIPYGEDLEKELSRRKALKEKWGNGNGAGMTLGVQAQMAGWPTCSSRDWKDTPGMATTGVNPDGSERTRLDQLPRVASLAGWPTPHTPRLHDSDMSSSQYIDKTLGLRQNSFGVGTERTAGFRLNPLFSLWLMGFPPIGWACCGVRAMLSASKRGKRS
jgi:hypothetical protein